MPIRSAAFRFAALFALVGPPSLAGALQAPAREPEEVPEVEEGDALLAKGEYDRAIALFGSILDARPADDAARGGKARALLARGRYEEAIELLAPTPRSGANERLRGEALAALGRNEEAEAAFRAAAARADDLPAQAALADFLARTGRSEEAERLRRAVARAAVDRVVDDAPGLVALGRAYVGLGRFEDASEVFVEAIAKDAGASEASVALGDLYFRVYRDAAGLPSPVEEYREALRRNPNDGAALLGSFRVYRSNFNRDPAKAEGFLGKALAVNPRDVEALVDRAELRIVDRRFEEARASLEEALRVHPRHRRARVERAALDFLEGRKDAYESEGRALAAEDPASADLPAALGSHLIDLYRFADAVGPLNDAVARDPKDARARTDLGRALANVGREAEAAEALREAAKIEEGFVHPWRTNMLTVLDHLERAYVTVDAAPFRLKLHPDEAPVLRELLAPLLGEALETLSKRYGYRPPSTVHFEVFHEYGDFSVRTLGFTGFGALGVCFGPVITAVSPLAAEVRGKFSWEATAWHEFAHVLTIGLSRSRVPRWLTEGLSVLEERRRDPGFDRGMDLDLLNARANGAIYPIEELNGAFRGPRILFGYYQGGLICEWLERTHPFDATLKMLRLYGEDRPTREILGSCFGLTPEAFDRGFAAFVDEKLADVRVEPFRDEAGLGRLRARLRTHPDDLDAAVSLAWEQMRRGNAVDAAEGVRRVLAKHPGHGRAHLLAGELALARGRSDVARREYEAGFAAGAEEFFARVHHAKLLEKDEAFDAAIEAWRAAKRAYPRFAADEASSPHLALHRLLEGEGKSEEAERELEEFAALGSHALDPILALAAYAERRGDAERAQRWLRRAVGVDPFRRELLARWGRSLRETGRYPEAIRAFRAARGVKPETEGEPRREGEADLALAHAELFREEAEAHLAAGDRASAAEAAKRALEIAPDDARAAEILESATRASSG